MDPSLRWGDGCVVTPEAILALAAEPEAVQRAVLKRLTGPQRRELRERWLAWAHPGQTAPPASAGAGGGDWRVWLVMAGRGFGKTRAGAEWVSARGAGRSRAAHRFGRRHQ